MRILVTGSRGQIGSQIRKILPDDWELPPTPKRSISQTPTALKVWLQAFSLIF